MPTYEYKCKKCGYEFEEFQSITAEPLKKCPECKGKVERVISAGAGILFKGSGFYETDYRSSEYKKKASEEKKSTDKKPADKKENKPEKKVKTKTDK